MDNNEVAVIIARNKYLESENERLSQLCEDLKECSVEALNARKEYQNKIAEMQGLIDKYRAIVNDAQSSYDNYVKEMKTLLSSIGKKRK